MIWKLVFEDKPEEYQPPMGVPLIITLERNVPEGPRRVTLGPVYRIKDTDTGAIGYFVGGHLEDRIDQHYFKVIAYDMWPEPLQEKSEC